MSLTTKLAIIAIATTPLSTTPASSTTPQATTPAPLIKVIGCTQKEFRYRVRKVYAKKRITKSDHEWIFQARKCLKHQDQAIAYQRKYSKLRKQRLDPWGHAWSQVSPSIKARLRRLKMCESTGNYRAVNGPYNGAYQYHRNTWARAGGTGEAMNASPREQDVRTARFWPSHMSEWACKA